MTLRRSTPTRAAGLLVALAALALVVLLSISVGAKPIPPHRVWELLFHDDGSQDAIVVHDLRIPRTVLGLLVGAALGVAGALMQALTRNPLADPGLLGINAGAATAIVLGVALLGVTSATGYVWFGFAGAALASVIVYGIGAQGRSGATPVRLALAGTAVTAALGAVVNGITIVDTRVLERYRFWVVGALGGHDTDTIRQVAPFMVVGLLLALALARPLNALALGEDAGRALGAHVGRTRVAGAAAVTLLCGAATAAAGPIVFIGLTVPHVARALCGPDQRWVLPYSAVLAPVFLLTADVLGRVIDRPGEIEVGVVCAFLGGPVFVALIRRRRIAQL
ncbi:MAG TPA: iron chelate uptake ABC transporter family permease subunit [Baekduia sp.]|uniref:FecCD family ABC transporter permease n=1 Tax=Baekduia sp. TaxID=2600305 RepID=UPI002D79D47A|nr:iron chelate uptake ABC transporter family permease subunit [Baekduia sp.]HET6508168.1 iron chelate uptake ABC transporter family permease subunit [Baekduia sp.]